ncbi:HAD-IIB family hydrolase [Mycoplasma nasistruthionis]|uniref:HAD family phosphatase n=1 Tax=Mycoplasma nasistruthionis TaxID=353852 RepID=A0A5B7XWT0_9MOLU|nr:HAD family hydrolase [Mycoplasma nasistruthionis]QCZ36975.1 HAD family phosphatase [Mycoplasma nasistruthionis]
MKKPKIIFIDLDGTTLDDGPGLKFWQKDTTEYTRKTLLELNKTIPVVASTGRGAKESTSKLVSNFGPETYIAWNGAKTIENGQVVHEYAFSKENTQKLFDELARNFCFVVFNSDGRNSSFARNKFLRLFMGFAKQYAKPYKAFKNDFTIYKAFVWSWSTRRIQKLAKKWQEQYKGIFEIAITGSKNNRLEITPADCSKGSAEVRYCLSKGIDPQDAMHIGDSLNDASTKGKIGTLVAMKNSVQELKDIADVVTEYECDESGLAKFLEQFIEKTEN